MALLTSDAQSGLGKFAQRLSKTRPEKEGRSWSTRIQPRGGVGGQMGSGTEGLGSFLRTGGGGNGVWKAAALKRLKQARDPHCRMPCVPAWASLPGPASYSPASTWTTPGDGPRAGATTGARLSTNMSSAKASQDPVTTGLTLWKGTRNNGEVDRPHQCG